MSRGRKGLGILMRARMRAPNENKQDPHPLSSPSPLSPPPHHVPPNLDLGPRSSPPPPSSSSLSNANPHRVVVLNDVTALMHASISTDTNKLSGTVDTTLQDFMEAYLILSCEDRRELLLVLARDYDVNRMRVRELMSQYLGLDLPDSCGGIVEQQSDNLDEGVSLSAFYRAERNLRQALKPMYVVFFERLNAHTGGLKLLATLRADLLCVLAEKNVASLRALDSYLKEKLITWLSPANLELLRITWDDSASLLEKIVAYEAVHPIRNLLDLKRRLSVGRRCFGYFHPAIPGEPLIFIEVALLKNMAQTIQEVLWDNPPIPECEATCALFYSISSTQPGLSGINLGKFLIKRVVKLLKREMPHVLTFATLSPIPGYMQWLLSKLASQSKLAESEIEDATHMSLERSGSTFRENLFYPEEERAILDACMESTAGKNCMEVMQNLLGRGNNDWAKSDQLSAILQPPLMRLCARYLLKEKKRGKALDAVANFHLQNGAMIERINWMSDQSEKGICQSGGIMVNYVYRLEKIEENAESYFNMGHIEASPNLHLYLEEVLHHS